MDKLASRTLVAGVAALVLIVLGYILFDRPISLAAHTLAHTDWHQWGAWISMLADHHWFNALLLAGLLWGAVDAYLNGWTARSRGVVFACLSVTLAMLAGDVFKYTFGRCRPPLLFSQGQYGFVFFMGDDMHHSFPSGHTLRAFSAATALGLLFARARIPLLALACLVGVSRVVVTRHFPGDVIFGAFIGVMAALWTWRSRAATAK